MANSENLTPQIRFAGFTGDWVQRKLGEVAEFSKGNGYSKIDLCDNGNPIILYGRLYTNYETVIENVDTFAEIKGNPVISYGGEVIVPSSGETAEDISRASVVAEAGVILGGDLNIIKPNSSINPAFLAITISNGNQQKELSKRAQGKSVVHLSNSDFKDVVLQLPTLSEQTAIGNFFRTFDDTIVLCKRKLDRLKKLKNGYLQVMFPQAGKCVPRVRFAGFAEPWEKKKLGEVAEIVSGGTPDTSNLDYWDGEINWYSPTEIGKEIYAFNSQRKITELGLKKSSAKILPANKTILFTSRAGIGDMAILKKSAATNQGFQSLVVNEDFDVYFIFTMGNEIKDYALKNASGSTFLEISGKVLSKMELYIPTIIEQTVIGNLFRNLDEQIAAQHQKLNQLKQLKSAYLQKMFI